MNDNGRELEAGEHDRPPTVCSKRDPQEDGEKPGVDHDERVRQTRKIGGMRKEANDEYGESRSGDLGRHRNLLRSAASSQSIDQAAEQADVERDDSNHRLQLLRAATIER